MRSILTPTIHAAAEVTLPGDLPITQPTIHNSLRHLGWNLGTSDLGTSESDDFGPGNLPTSLAQKSFTAVIN